MNDQVKVQCPECVDPESVGRRQFLTAVGGTATRADRTADALAVIEQEVKRMAEEGPWYALGDGETFEDMIFSTLFSCGHIRCSECGEAVNVTEETLGQLTMEVLGSW